MAPAPMTDPALRGRGSRFDPRRAVAGPSDLGERAREEYGYVLRELRSIGILVALMTVVLLAAWIGFRAFEIGPG